MLVTMCLKSVCQIWLHMLCGRTLHLLQEDGQCHHHHHNDLTLTLNSSSLLSGCKSDLQSEFEITKMGEIHWLLGVEIKQNCHARTVTLSQKAYIDTVCACFHLQDA